MTFRDFIHTRRQMAAHMFGNLVGDAQWEDDYRQFLVYDERLWIEILDDGRYHLQLEREEHIGTLDELERKLYAWEWPFEPTAPSVAEVRAIREAEECSLPEARHRAETRKLEKAFSKLRAEGTLEDKVEWLLNRFEGTIGYNR